MAMDIGKMIDRVGSVLKEQQKASGRDKEKLVDPGIERAGTKIVLPNEPQPMPILEAVGALLRYMEDEETLMDVRESIEAYPLDAAVAFNEAMRQIYGWSSPQPKPSWWGPIPPDLITVTTGPGENDYVQVPWGDFRIPGIENPISLRAAPGPVFMILGKVRKRERHVLVDLAKLTKAILRDRSIYRGKALQLIPKDSGNLDINDEPKFFDASPGVDLILNGEEQDQLEAALWTPIKHTAECKKHGIPLKRGILLEGPYGTGKTLAAKETARICNENGWTFIMLDDVRALADALVFARRFEPAVVFAEDIDRLIEHRTQQGNDLLNTIDGVLSKDAKVITVLTTNHVDKINKAMLRPGRFDAVIRMRPPQEEAVKRLIHLYGRGLIPATEPLNQVAVALAGNIPATIREVVERSKLSMISASRKKVLEEDLIIAATGMKGHMELLKEAPAAKSLEEQLGDNLGKVVRKANGLDVMEKKIDNIETNVDRILDIMG